MRLPDIVGVKLTGKRQPGITATDIVLAITEFLRKEITDAQFVLLGEYHGSRRISELTRAIVPIAHAAGCRTLALEVGPITAEVLTESLFLLMMGMAAGNFLSFLSLTALADTGIDLSAFAAGVEYAGMPRIIYPAVKPYNAIVANLVVLVLGLIVSLYPALKAARFTPVKAMAQH